MTTPEKGKYREYLGDGVYVDYEPSGYIELTTEDGITVHSTILLDVLVWDRLLDYAKRLGWKVSNG